MMGPAMALAAGTRLGPYEILAPLGAGGMGEVYKAHDTRLKRDVAIKVLPAALASDPDRMARFEREARLLASLDHPNIGAIYGLEESNGTRALILALIEGPTLSDRIAAGPIPLDETVPIAQQMAEALEYAHERGVIHRDLKPANVKITPEGTVKVLDFGLAKALSGEPDAPSASISPTLTMRATQAGVILGTAAYMAPEQAKGKPVDRRADIWAFGVVLFEMLTSKPPFSGDSVAEIMASTIKEEPNLDRLPPSTPLGVRRLIERCLIKDPSQRLRDIGEARIALQNLGKEPEAAARVESTTSRPGKLPWIAAGVMTAFAAVALWSPWRVEKPVARPLVRLDVDLGADVSLPVPGPGGRDFAISPDGTRLAYVSGTPAKLLVRRLDQPNATTLPGTEDAGKPFFSPDGQWVGFLANHKVSKISVEGGAVVPLFGDSSTFGGASWDKKDSIILSEATSKGLLRIPPDGGPPETVAKLGTGETALNQPQVLPGGKAILFSATGVSGEDRNTVEVLTLSDGHRKVVARGGANPRYLPTGDGVGHLVYLNNATLFAVPFDLAKLETRGTPVPVLYDVAYYPGTGAGQFDFSAAPSGHGTFVYRRAIGGAAFGMMTLQWVDPTGSKELLRAKPGGYEYPSVSPDGNRIALSLSDGGSPDIWVYDPQRDAMTRLTFGSECRYPVWSPDGRYVVFGCSGKGIFQTRADGAGQPQALTESKTRQIPWSFTPDGKWLAYSDYNTGLPQLWTVRLEDVGGRLKAGKPEPFLKSSFTALTAAFSPDGHWLAYSSNSSGDLEVYVRPFPPPSSGQGGQWQISNSGGYIPRWSPNGRDLFYWSNDQIMAVSYTIKGGTFLPEKPRVWIRKLGGTRWDLARDGKRVLVRTPVESPKALNEEREIVFLENFFDYLRQRVPIGK
jgi:serine/threonine-protein kinase